METKIPILGNVIIDGPTTNFHDQKILIGISAKNKLFSKKLLRKCFNFIKFFQCESLITIFDLPYAFNSSGNRNILKPSLSECKNVILLGNEKERMVIKILRNYPSDYFTLQRWSILSKTPIFRELKKEFYQAAKISSFYNYLEKQANIWDSNITPSRLKYFIGFQLEELPMLIMIYYHLDYLIDIYPGKNFPLFKEIENGFWEKELPLSTNLSKNKYLTFINVS